MWWKINGWIFFFLIIIVGVTYFTRENYRGVDAIDSLVCEEPVQEELEDNEEILFRLGELTYSLEPLYHYDISGLIVSKKDYSWFSIYKRSKALPIDLCLLWGENAAKKIFASHDLSFSQDMRYCRYVWKGKLKLNVDEVSNNHLLIASNKVNKKVKGLTRGDQVRVVGKLVNVHARHTGSPDLYDPAYFRLNSSVSRSDIGTGSCEVIYVEDVEILKRANPISNFLFKVGLFGLVALVLVNFFGGLYILFRPVEK